MTYGAYFVVSVVESGQESEQRDESGGGGDGEQFETFVEEVHEADETRIVVTEADAHQQRADDVGHGAAQKVADLDRRRPLTGHRLQESLHFTLQNHSLSSIC